MGGFVLIPHPQTPSKAVTGISGTLMLQSAGRWNLGFTLEGSVAQLALPEPEAPQRKDELWKTTCFELFVRDPATEAYLEFNLSPSGNWAAYAFDGYREGMCELDVAAIRITTTDPRQFALGLRAHLCGLGMAEEVVDAMLAADEIALDPPPADRFVLSGLLEDGGLEFGSKCEVGISAVIEELDGTKSYWALAHPPGAPDFHHPTCFAATLPPPSET